MNLKFDAEQFDRYQAILASEIAERVMIKLREAGMEGKKLEECTAAITFSIANVIDDMAAIESDGVEVRPYLTFRTGDDEILHCGENACTNTFVYDVLKKLFS
ncbi:MAG: hypothetical protein ACFCVA_16345 [Gammaproteobacteria bacterium]